MLTEMDDPPLNGRSGPEKITEMGGTPPPSRTPPVSPLNDVFPKLTLTFVAMKASRYARSLNKQHFYTLKGGTKNHVIRSHYCSVTNTESFAIAP